nr:uncharacterized protein LOC111985901 [Quercus suber]
MVLGFELFFDCDNKLPELKKEDVNWVPTDWVDYMDLDAITMLLGDAICNIEEEETIDDEDKEGGKALNDDDESSDNSSSDSGDSGDNNSSSDSDSNSSEDYDSQYNGNDRGEPPSDREDDIEVEDEDIENDVEVEDEDIEENAEEGTDYDQYPYGQPSVEKFLS